MALTNEDLTAIQAIVRGETEPIKADLESFARATNEQFLIIDKRFDGVDLRLDGIDLRLDGIDLHLDHLECDTGEIKNTLQFHRLDPRSGKKS